MDGIVGSLRLGWNAMLFKENAYEEMRLSASPASRPVGYRRRRPG